MIKASDNNEKVWTELKKRTGPSINPTLNHFDGLIKYPSVTVDGKPLMETDGTLFNYFFFSAASRLFFISASCLSKNFSLITKTLPKFTTHHFFKYCLRISLHTASISLLLGD
jgi:hypothetical protein